MSIAEEMVEHLNLSIEDVVVISELIDSLIIKLVPTWKPSSGNCSSEANSSFGDSPILQIGGNSGSLKAPVEAVPKHNVLPQLAVVEDEDNQESTVSDISAEYGASMASDACHDDALESDYYSLDEGSKALNGYGFNSEAGVYDHGGQNEKTYEDIVGESDMINQPAKNSATSYVDSCSGMSKNFSLSSICSLSLADKDQYGELKLELDAIDTQYHQRLIELLRMREEAIENAKRRWISKKKISVV